MKRITKADIIQGKNKRVEVKIPELNGSVYIRPLTDGEYSQVQSKILEGLKFSGKATLQELTNYKIDLSTLNMAEMVEGQKKAERMAVAFAIVPAEGEENWTEEDVANLPPEVPERILEKIYEISGVANDSNKQVSSFRNKR